MPESFEIASAVRTYQVNIGKGLFDAELAGNVLIADRALTRMWPRLAGPKSILIDAVEDKKTLDTVAGVIESMRAKGMNRSSHMVAVGGGIVQDVASFAASVYMRGIEWSYYPTTLLGMVDSCIGGKSSINIGQYKNIAGSFHPPVDVVVDVQFVESLPMTQRVAGLCEAVKICFAAEDDTFETYLTLAGAGAPLTEDALEHIICLALKTKKTFIEVDEFDNGVRLLLNFGHTFGHALEASTDFKVSHGVAVGLGMLAACQFSIASGSVPHTNSRMSKLIDHLYGLLSAVTGLSDQIVELDVELAMQKFRSDKKHRQGEYALIAIDETGFLKRIFVPTNAVNEERITQSFLKLKEIVYEIQ